MLVTTQMEVPIATLDNLCSAKSNKSDMRYPDTETSMKVKIKMRAPWSKCVFTDGRNRRNVVDEAVTKHSNGKCF